jgi:hypothetical protein
MIISLDRQKVHRAALHHGAIWSKVAITAQSSPIG